MVIKPLRLAGGTSRANGKSLTMRVVLRAVNIPCMDYEDLLIRPVRALALGENQLLTEYTSEDWKPEVPSDSTILWRYMNFSKFMLLLHHNALFFSLVKNTEDKYEGYTHPPKQSDEEDERLHQAELTAHEILTEIKQESIICCWTESEYESNVMWKSYTGNEKEGIAIKTTYGDLLESIHHQVKEYLIAGKVKYVDYRDNQISISNLAPLFHKRREFESEEEIRVAASVNFEFEKHQIVIDPEIEKNGGLYIPVDLNKLVREVVVSPYSDPWFKDLVCQQVEQASLKARVVPSTI